MDYKNQIFQSVKSIFKVLIWGLSSSQSIHLICDMFVFGELAQYKLNGKHTYCNCHICDIVFINSMYHITELYEIIEPKILLGWKKSILAQLYKSTPK